MVVSVEHVARKYFDVVADTPISVDIPAFEASDVYVYYGSASTLAVLNADYTLTLAEDFNTFVVTPLAALITKIDALITADATETNFITVRRALDYKTEATPANVRYTPYTSKEFDRAAMRDQQMQDTNNRAVKLDDKFAAPYPDLAIKTVPEAGDVEERALVFLPGGGVGVGPTSSEIKAAEEYAQTLRASMMIPISETETSVLVSIGTFYFVSESDTPYPSITLEAV